MPVTAPDHFTILTDDVPRTVAFYGELLGLVPGARPPFSFPGAWLYAEGRPILHVIGDAPRSSLRAGVIDHMAFKANGLAGTLALLKARGIVHEVRPLPGAGTIQLFFHDPNGARVELDFDPSERAQG
jgi:catechol 2,3-dioxygenase-like lactoylglutathione lyase family enzyme